MDNIENGGDGYIRSDVFRVRPDLLLKTRTFTMSDRAYEFLKLLKKLRNRRNLMTLMEELFSPSEYVRNDAISYLRDFSSKHIDQMYVWDDEEKRFKVNIPDPTLKENHKLLDNDSHGHYGA